MDMEVVEEIEGLAAEGWGATQIKHKLERQPRYKDRALPTLRTIQRIVAERTVRDTSGPWSLNEAGPDARTVLDVLAAVIDGTEGRTSAFTGDEAQWVLQVSQVAPDLPPFERWRIARLYLGRASRVEPTDDLDGFLAYAPWRDDGAGWKRYDHATMDGWVRHVPYFLTRTIQFGSREEFVGEAEHAEHLAEADQAEQTHTRGWQQLMKRGGLTWENHGPIVSDAAEEVDDRE